VTATAISSPIPTAGDRAPDFTLASTSGEKISLAQYKQASNVLIAFFPLAFTSTCTAEMCSFSDDFDQFTGKGVTVLPISVDSVPTLKEFKAKYGMKTDLLSDFKREASRAYGVLLDDLFFSRRAYFLIDRDGIVRWSHVESEIGHKRDNRELLERIAALG
jgi:peroxiredoxin